ncbi:MAG: VWA-like domain-containing protein [Erysipelotrichaceae bacterium]|nr:VWA-like domain-containing protein [Erysipelotrichaceae bacterium]
MHTSLDEFDYIYYTYGLELYKDTPLIEPLEYREDKKIRDFVIVIDTSGSVQGDMVQLFLQKTWNILKQQEAFDKQFNLHLIQCDSQIKHDEVITNQRELDIYLSKLTLKGFGGTDFRPAFDYVDELIQDNVFHQLKGMLYFTDGLGIYPKRVPSYLTAFVFINYESAYYAKIPPWALQIVVEKEDLEIL